MRGLLCLLALTMFGCDSKNGSKPSAGSCYFVGSQHEGSGWTHRVDKSVTTATEAKEFIASVSTENLKNFWLTEDFLCNGG